MLSSEDNPVSSGIHDASNRFVVIYWPWFIHDLKSAWSSHCLQNHYRRLTLMASFWPKFKLKLNMNYYIWLQRLLILTFVFSLSQPRGTSRLQEYVSEGVMVQSLMTYICSLSRKLWTIFTNITFVTKLPYLKFHIDTFVLFWPMATGIFIQN